MKLIKEVNPVSISCWGSVELMTTLEGCRLLRRPRACDLLCFTWQQGRSPVDPHESELCSDGEHPHNRRRARNEEHRKDQAEEDAHGRFKDGK